MTIETFLNTKELTRQREIHFITNGLPDGAFSGDSLRLKEHFQTPKDRALALKVYKAEGQFENLSQKPTNKDTKASLSNADLRDIGSIVARYMSGLFNTQAQNKPKPGRKSNAHKQKNKTSNNKKSAKHKKAEDRREKMRTALNNSEFQLFVEQEQLYFAQTKDPEIIKRNWSIVTNLLEAENQDTFEKVCDDEAEKHNLTYNSINPIWTTGIKLLEDMLEKFEQRQRLQTDNQPN